MKLKPTLTRRFVTVAVIAALICISSQAGYAAASPVISVEPTYTGISYGGTFTVDITIDPGGDEVMGAEYKLYFNDSLLKVLSQNKGSFLSQDGASTMGIVNKIDGMPIEYGEMRMDTEVGATAPGTLTTITFEVIGDPGAGELRLADVVLANPPPGGENTKVTVRTGRVGVDQPSTPFIISGYVSHGGGSECNDPVVNVTLNTSREGTVVTAESSNYYQIVLASPDDVIAGDVLRFEVVCGDGSNVTEHIVTQAEVDAGGFGYDIVLDVEALPGDLNSDGVLTTADAAIALRMAVCGGYDRVADVNNDKSVTSLDALMILQAASV
jgi:hypothetical protein